MHKLDNGQIIETAAGHFIIRNGQPQKIDLSKGALGGQTAMLSDLRWTTDQVVVIVAKIHSVQPQGELVKLYAPSARPGLQNETFNLPGHTPVEINVPEQGHPTTKRVSELEPGDRINLQLTYVRDRGEVGFMFRDLAGAALHLDNPGLTCELLPDNDGPAYELLGGNNHDRTS